MFRSSEQRLFHEIVARHFAAPIRPLLAQAATGLGKTRAYLAAAAQAASHGQRIAIALPSWALIDQLLASGDLALTRGTLNIATFRPRRRCDNVAEYEAQAEAARSSHIMLCTAAAVLIDNAAQGAYCGAIERSIIFDEADQLPDAAALRADVEITPVELRDLNIAAKTTEAIAAAVLAHPRATTEQRAIARLVQQYVTEAPGYALVGRTDQDGIAVNHPRPGRMLKRISNLPSSIFISATLQIRGSFDAFRRAMAIEEISPLSTAIEPKRHGDLSFIYQPRAHDTEDWFTEVISSIATAPRPCLVLVPSHDLAERIGAAAGGRVRGHDEPLREAAAEAESQGLFIAAGAWAGLDTPTRWASLVIPRAPFPRLRVLEGEAVDHYLDSHATTVRRLGQGLGRVLRFPEARAKVIILDQRLVTHGLESCIPERFRSAWEEAKRAALSQGFEEGTRFELTLSRAERDPALRKAALSHYGLRCTECGFVPQVSSQLEVHHLNPIAEGKRRTVLTDVTVLCANCHRLVHARLRAASAEGEAV